MKKKNGGNRMWIGAKASGWVGFQIPTKSNVEMAKAKAQKWLGRGSGSDIGIYRLSGCATRLQNSVQFCSKWLSINRISLRFCVSSAICP